MQRTPNSYQSSNAEFKESLHIDYAIRKEVRRKSELDKWLTERYSLFQDGKKGINKFDIHHVEWPINQLVVKGLDVNYPQFEALLSSEPDKMHYSTGVQVLAWGKEKS